MRAREFAKVLDEISFMDPEIPGYLTTKRRHEKLGSGMDQTVFKIPRGRWVLKVFGGAATQVASYDIQKTPSQVMYLQWVDYCVQHARSNEFLPRFRLLPGNKYTHEFLFQGRLFLATFQEKLFDTFFDLRVSVSRLSYALETRPAREKLLVIANEPGPITNPGFRDLRWLEIYEPMLNTLLKHLTKQDLAKLIHTIIDIRDLGDSQGWDWDLHWQNVMIRGDGTPVIADPWYIHYQSWGGFANRLQNSSSS